MLMFTLYIFILYSRIKDKTIIFILFYTFQKFNFHAILKQHKYSKFWSTKMFDFDKEHIVKVKLW